MAVSDHITAHGLAPTATAATEELEGHSCDEIQLPKHW